LEEVEMVKVRISCDEYYPFYAPDGLGYSEVSISEEILERWNRVMQEFEAVQKEMEQAINGEKHDPN
jgi:hypothetical protein